MKHTPGPWTICSDPFWKNSFVILGEDGGVAVGQCNFSGISCSFSKCKDIEEVAANASLIAAAPELLKALQAIAARINGEWDNPALAAVGALSHDTKDDILGFAEAAIAKATTL